MPFWIPVILGGAALASVIKGVSDGVEGSNLRQKATDIIEDARHSYDASQWRLIAMQRDVEQMFAGYRQTCLDARWVMKEALRVLEQSEHQSDYAGSSGLVVPGYASFDSLHTTTKLLDLVASGAGHAVQGALAGAAAGSSLTWLATMLGAASTGTAISTLGGAAASNAAMAWLGGGALIAGGGGMALGSMLLGGVAIAPVALFVGAGLVKKGEEALTRAYEIRADANIKCQQMELMVLTLQEIGRRLYEMQTVLQGLDRLAQEQFQRVRRDPSEPQAACLLAIVSSMETLMKTPVFAPSGKVTSASKRVVSSIERQWR